MLMYSGRRLWLVDRYGMWLPVRYVKDVGNGLVIVQRKGCVSTITVRRSSLRRVRFFEREQWSNC